MCQHCNYSEMLEVSGLEATPKRMRVIEVIGNNSSPVSAQDIFVTLRRITNINRVTVYRILDVLVDRRLVDRLSSGGRNQVYGMAPNEQHPAHPHFLCDSCGALQCLQPGSLKVDLKGMERSFTGEIKNVEVRVNGTCRNCLKKA